MDSPVTAWLTPAGKYVYAPASLFGLPQYKADACRLFMAGRSELIAKALL